MFRRKEIGMLTGLTQAGNGATGMPLPSPHAPGGPLADVSRVRFGRCELRPACRELWVNGHLKTLQPKPFDLLLYLIRHHHRVVTADELFAAIWNHQAVGLSSLATAIGRIRAVIGDGQEGQDEFIRTYHRIGYRFVAAVEADGDPT
jgi:DNA-binding winged helix-turn-helix (wHTH) protein